MDNAGSVERISQIEWRKRIEHEDDLISNRISWLIGSQAFLIGAFVSIHTSFPNISGNGSQLLQNAQVKDIPSTGLLSYLIIIVGATVSIGSFLGYVAAVRAIDFWRSKLDAEMQSLLTCGKCWEFFGGLTGFVIGPVLTAMWILFFLKEFDHIFAGMSKTEILTPIFTILLAVLLWGLYSFKIRAIADSDRKVRHYIYRIRI